MIHASNCKRKMLRGKNEAELCMRKTAYRHNVNREAYQHTCTIKNEKGWLGDPVRSNPNFVHAVHLIDKISGIGQVFEEDDAKKHNQVGEPEKTNTDR